MKSMVSVLGDREAMVTLGARIRDARLLRNWSQAHIAAILDVSLPTYRKIEQGDGRVEFRHVVRTLAALGYAEAVTEMIQPLTSEVTMKQLMDSSQRKRASRPRKTP